MKISICAEVSISDHQQALEKGGVWLIVEINDKRYSHYLNPEELISWIEGVSIRNIVGFSELPEIYRDEAYDKFDAELHKVVK